jgi:hypothetical protein
LQPVSLKKSKKNETYKVCLKWGGKINSTCKKSLTKDQFYVGPAFIQYEGTLQRTIEYSGKAGKIIKFTYSEFIDRNARDAFTREFSIDLSEGNIAAYKGAVFEVLETTNAEIAYRIIRHFPK